MKLTHTTEQAMGTAALLATVIATPAQAAQKICVYDMLGASGDLFNMAKDYAVAMQKHGVSVELKAYNNDERVASLKTTARANAMA